MRGRQSDQRLAAARPLREMQTRERQPRSDRAYAYRRIALQPSRVIVPPDLFYTAQGILRERAHRFNDEELVEKLRRLFQQRGYLSGLIIDEAEGMPSAAAYAHRFGSLIRAPLIRVPPPNPR